MIEQANENFHESRGSGLATLGLVWKGVEPLDSGKTGMRRLIKPISTLLLVVAIPMALVDPALAETRTARNGEAVIEYQIDGKGPAVLMIASLGRPARDFDELSANLVAAGYSTIRPQPRGIGGSTGPGFRRCCGLCAAIRPDARPALIPGQRERDRKFADSPLEGAGFEPSVPLAKEGRAPAWNSSLDVTRRILRA